MAEQRSITCGPYAAAFAEAAEDHLLIVCNNGLGAAIDDLGIAIVAFVAMKADIGPRELQIRLALRQYPRVVPD